MANFFKSIITKRCVCLLMMCAMFLSVFTACTVKSKDDDAETSIAGRTIKLTVWGAAEDQDLLKEIIEDFKNENPQSIFEFTQKIVGEDKAQEEVKKDPTEAADVFAVAHDQIGKLVDDGLIYENTKYVNDVKAENTEGSILACTYKDKLYAYPASQKTYFLYYDKRIFSGDDVQSLDKMLSKNVSPGTIRLGIDMGDAYYTTSFFLTNGCELFGKDGMDPKKVTFNDQNGLEAAKYIQSLKAKGVSSVKLEESDSRFAEGKMGAYITGDWKAVSFQEKLGDNYAVAKLPMLNMGSGDKQMKSFAGYNVYCVSANTKEPLAAMQFANFLANRKNQEKRFNVRKLLPVNKSVISDVVSKNDMLVNAAMNQLNDSVVMPSIAQMNKFWAPTSAFCKDVFEGKIAEANLQKSLDSLVDDILL